MTTADVLASALTFDGRIVFSMGCHAGLNVPDAFLPASARADWAEAFAGRKAAVFVGNTGFGFGDTDLLAYGEDLNRLFARSMVSGEYTLGQALAQAKQDYIGSLQPVGVYDEKTSAELTLYGLPMWKIGTGSALPPTPPPATTVVDPLVGLTAQSIDTTPTFTSRSTPRGTYWEGGDGTQVTQFRPIQPKEIEIVGIPNPHGALITELTSATPDANFDPVYARPVVDSAANEPELPYNDVIFPAQLQAVTRQSVPGSSAVVSKLVLVTGQFTGRPDVVDSTGTGTEDRFTRFRTLVYSAGAAAEYQPPVFSQVDALAIDNVGQPVAAQFNVKVADVGGSGIKRVLVAYQDGSTPVWKFIDLVQGQDGSWTGQGARQAANFRYFVQAVDGSGNVAVTTNKGVYYAQKGTIQVPGDVVPPSISIASPAAISYAYGEVVLASYVCSDPDSVVTSCTAALNGSATLIKSGDPVPTTTAGSNTLTVTAVSGGQTVSKPVTFTVSPSSGATVVFARSDHIFKITPAGAVVQLTSGKDDEQPALSPDGTKIAFAREVGDKGQIFTMNTSGGNVVQLTTTGDNDAPAWLPGSGARIAFHSSRTGSKGKDVYVMNADGTSPVNITNASGDDVTPAWSPDGTKLAFASNRTGQFEIYTMTSTGATQKALTNDKRTDIEPAWSPDGSKLTFSSNRATSGTSNGQEIYVMGSDTGNKQLRLTTIAGDDTAPLYLDANRIVFASGTFGGGGLAIVAPTGGTVTKISGTMAMDATPG